MIQKKAPNRGQRIKKKNPQVAFQNQARQAVAPQPDRDRGLPMRTPNQGMAPLASSFMNRGTQAGMTPTQRPGVKGIFGNRPPHVQQPQPAPQPAPWQTVQQFQAQSGTNNVGAYSDALTAQFGSQDAAMAAIMGGVTPNDPNWGAVWNAATPEQRTAFMSLHSAQRFGHGTAQPQAPAPQPGPQQSPGWPQAPQPQWQQTPPPMPQRPDPKDIFGNRPPHQWQDPIPRSNPPQANPGLRPAPQPPFSEGSGANAAAQGPNAPQGWGQDQARDALANAGVDPQGKGRSGGPADEKLGLPLSPEFEAGRRALDDELAGTLSAIGVAEQDAIAMVNLIKQRLATDLAEEMEQVDESANARGLYDSGIRTSNRDKTQLGYDRRTQDLAMDAARQLREFAAGKSGAQSSYGKGLAELLMESARSSATDENAATPRTKSGPKKRTSKPKKKKGKGKPRG